MKVAVVGATGLVGSVMIKLLDERNFPVTEFIPVASEKSAGKEVVFQNRKYKVVTPENKAKLGFNETAFSGVTTLYFRF